MTLKLPATVRLPLLGVAALFLGFAATAWAQEKMSERPAPPDPAKMEAVRACAKAKGVDMPAPPARDERPAGPPPEKAESAPGKLSEEQRKIVDACLEANGVARLRGPHGPR